MIIFGTTTRIKVTAHQGQFHCPDCGVEHEHRGTHDGQEAGFVCEMCQDGIMGLHPDFATMSQVPRWP